MPDMRGPGHGPGPGAAPGRALTVLGIRPLWLALGLVGFAVLGAGTYVVYDLLAGGDGGAATATAAKAGSDGAAAGKPSGSRTDSAAGKPSGSRTDSAAGKPSAAASSSADAGSAGTSGGAPAAGAADGGAATATGSPTATGSAAAAADAGTPVATATTPPKNGTVGDGDDTVPAGSLVIRSVPDGARVYVDGTPQGKTPVSLQATADKHTLAVIRPGYKLHVAEIQGGGAVDVSLNEATPSNGPGGIKVRCKEKDRYYIFVDGLDTGQLCPSERIGVDTGDHTVEIYDPITDERRQYRATVRQTRNSVRVRID